MNHENDNINMVTRIANVFGKDNISKLITCAAVGLALTIGVAMPAAVRPETPLISSFDSVSFLDDYLMDHGVSAKSKANTSSVDWFDEHLMGYGNPSKDDTI